MPPVRPELFRPQLRQYLPRVVEQTALVTHELFELCQIRVFLAVSIPSNDILNRDTDSLRSSAFSSAHGTRAEPFGFAIVFVHASFQHRQRRAFLVPPVLVLFALAEQSGLGLSCSKSR